MDPQIASLLVEHHRRELWEEARVERLARAARQPAGTPRATSRGIRTALQILVASACHLSARPSHLAGPLGR